MRGAWTSRPGAMVVAGAFGDIAVHHHPAVQLAVGLDGALSMVADDGSVQRCRIAVVAGGVRHALRSAGASAALSVYLSPQTPSAAALHALSTASGAVPGVWAVEEHADALARSVVTAVHNDDLCAAADLVIGDLLARIDRETDNAVHPQVGQAIELLAAARPHRPRLGRRGGGTLAGLSRAAVQETDRGVVRRVRPMDPLAGRTGSSVAGGFDHRRRPSGRLR